MLRQATAPDGMLDHYAHLTGVEVDASDPGEPGDKLRWFPSGGQFGSPAKLGPGLQSVVTAPPHATGGTPQAGRQSRDLCLGFSEKLRGLEQSDESDEIDDDVTALVAGSRC